MRFMATLIFASEGREQRKQAFFLRCAVNQNSLYVPTVVLYLQTAVPEQNHLLTTTVPDLHPIVEGKRGREREKERS